jgi:phosphatidylglycerol---prolipoprotein diacylglyceryl transferase
MTLASILAAIPFPDIDPVAVRLGPLAVHWYGLAYVGGFIGALVVLRWLARRWELGLSDDDLLTVILSAVVGLMVGARLGYVLLYGRGAYWEQPAAIFALWDGGMSFHGGLAGILLGGVVAARLVRVPWLTLCDIGAVGAPIGLGLGRIANFINAELWGRTTSVAWGVVFPGGGPEPRHPTQLYEAVLEGFVLFGVMLWLSRRMPPRPRGELLGWMLALYGAFRGFVEFFRMPDAHIGYLAGEWLTMGMALSLPLIIIGVALIVWARRQGLPQAPYE